MTSPHDTPQLVPCQQLSLRSLVGSPEAAASSQPCAWGNSALESGSLTLCCNSSLQALGSLNLTYALSTEKISTNTFRIKQTTNPKTPQILALVTKRRDTEDINPPPKLGIDLHWKDEAEVGKRIQKTSWSDSCWEVLKN